MIAGQGSRAVGRNVDTHFVTVNTVGTGLFGDKLVSENTIRRNSDSFKESGLAGRYYNFAVIGRHRKTECAVCDDRGGVGIFAADVPCVVALCPEVAISMVDVC